MTKTKWLLIGTIVITFAGLVVAQGGIGWDTAVWLNVGNSETPAQVNVTGSATQIVSNSGKRPDLICRNNTATTLWIGGNNTVTTANGLPILSSETFKAGSFTSTIYGVCDSGTCDVRCWAGIAN